jgi:hypothetical protein
MYQWIDEIHESNPTLSVARLCSALGVSRSGYYHWLGRKDRLSEESDIHLKELIYQIVIEFVGYGYRRVTHELRRHGYTVNHKKVLSLMRQENLLCQRNRRVFKTTMSSHSLPVYPNMAKRMILTGINQLWVSDITYISIDGSFVYSYRRIQQEMCRLALEQTR